MSRSKCKRTAEEVATELSGVRARLAAEPDDDILQRIEMRLAHEKGSFRYTEFGMDWSLAVTADQRQSMLDAEIVPVASSVYGSGWAPMPFDEFAEKMDAGQMAPVNEIRNARARESRNWNTRVKREGFTSVFNELLAALPPPKVGGC